MRSPSDRHDVDVVVVGGGAAGLSAALAASRTRSVALLVKTRLGDGATSWAQGGIAAALAPGDSPQHHLEDTLTAGAGRCHHEAVLDLVRAAPGVVETLVRLGAGLDRDRAGELDLGREGGHRFDRIVHAGGDRTGAEVSRTLAAAVRARPVEVVEEATVSDLLVDPQGRVAGVEFLDRAGVRHRLTARAVVLATGGLGQLYASTSNPREATGDGLALALRAGATIGDAEFVQFHPTLLWTGRDGSGQQPLVTEALRGAGAVLRDHEGRPVMQGVHPLADLAPRDVVASRLHATIRTGPLPHAYLDATHIGASTLAREFPGFIAATRAIGVDPARDLVPVAPGAHYHCGGAQADTAGVTDVVGLLAVGEVAWTGMHGANRLASNSLLEALATGARAGELLAERLPRPLGDVSVTPSLPGMPAVHRERLQQLMTRSAGLSRDESGLARLVDELDDLAAADRPATAADVENGHLRVAASLVARAALVRRESRGSHRRTDFPRADPAWRRPVTSRLSGGDIRTHADHEELSA
ncbi:MAG TPA: L-aspartate oxidase [Marmoricola sp.]|nr:L-aspartate oxidase [Marmoricola sp.]